MSVIVNGHGTLDVPNALAPIDDVPRDLGGWSKVLRDSDVAAQREHVALLIDRITPVCIGFDWYDVQVNWTPLGETRRDLAGVVTAPKGKE